MHRNSKRKYKLWAENPHCYWCGRLTIIVKLKPFEKSPPNLATVDHIRSRLNPERGSDKKVNTVLSCFECNGRRAEKETEGTSLEEIWQRSRRRPKESDCCNAPVRMDSSEFICKRCNKKTTWHFKSHYGVPTSKI